MRTPSTDAGALARCAAFQTLRPQASPIPLQDETMAYWRCWDARKQSTRCQRSGWSFICWLSAAHRFSTSRPSCLCGLRGYRGRAARETSARSECGSDQTQRVCSHADGAAPGDRIRGALHPRTAGRNSLKSGRRSMRFVIGVLHGDCPPLQSSNNKRGNHTTRCGTGLYQKTGEIRNIARRRSLRAICFVHRPASGGGAGSHRLRQA